MKKLIDKIKKINWMAVGFITIIFSSPVWVLEIVPLVTDDMIQVSGGIVLMLVCGVLCWIFYECFYYK